ncbi:ATP-binding protein [Pseudomonas sp. MAG002Y]|uniref:ATP-binding protein n=1 Tax=Pseudomonas sp. MAG002Y TaxID=2678690 RepID=UPI001C60F13F|nr:ATP-binding protein [Pseudomonas sp. MAG002Y]MBW5415230.1 HAMP domain-containing protein [Pseudomonas sp. MAG002Y]
MKISLSTKVFLAVLTLCAATVLAMGVAAYLSFTQGFLGYLNEQAVQRMESNLPRLQEAYAQHGDWSFLQERQEEWFNLLRPEGLAEGERPTSPPVSDLTGAFLRVTLLSAEKQYIAGYRQFSTPSILRAVRQGNEAVGWLAVTPFESVSAAGDQRFQKRQIRSGIVIGTFCLLLSALIAWWVTRGLLQPIKRVAAATHRLAAGDYNAQVVITSNDEVAQLAADFNKMASTLANNERQRRDFMADISHELRTPLAILRGELEAIEDGIRPINDNTVRSLQAEVLSLNKLVDDVHELSIAQVGGLNYQRQPVDLALLLSGVAQTFEPRLEEHGLHLYTQWHKSLWVHGDERRLNQLLYNLLENSLRYTSPGGEVHLRGILEGDHVRIDCEDTAPGVPEKDYDRLFERFYRVEHSRNRSSGGAGLGLAICQAIAEAHHGHLTAQASPKGGVWMRLYLPLTTADCQA